MYFCISSASDFVVGPDPIVGLVTSPGHKLMAVLTSDSLQIWSLHDSRALLLTTSLFQKKEEDVALRVMWDPAGEHLAVVTHRNTLLLLQIDIKYLESFIESRQVGGLAPDRIITYATLSISAPLVSLLLTPRHAILTSSVTGHITVVALVTGQVVQHLTPEVFGVNGDDSIVFMSYHPELRCYVVLTAASQCILSHQGCSKTAFLDLKPTDGAPRFIPGARLASLNKRYLRAAFACEENPTVQMFACRLEGPQGQLCLSAEPLSAWRLHTWSELSPPLGGIDTMIWTPDEEVLVVGYRTHGFAVFHHSGPCLMASFSRFQNSMSTAVRGIVSMPFGCSSIVFDRNCNNIIFAPRGGNKFSQIPLGRRNSSSTRGPPYFLTRDTLCLLHPGAETWDRIHIPSEYIASNHPLNFVSVTDEGSHAAVTGTHGCAIYSVERRRWTLFSDLSQEVAITCVCSPCWIDNAAIALPNKNHSQKRYELLFYPRNHLDRTAKVYEMTLPCRPVQLECVKAAKVGHYSMAVLDNGSTLLLYELLMHSDDLSKVKRLSVEVTHLYNIALDGPYKSPRAVHLVSLPTSVVPLLLVHCPDGSVYALDPMGFTCEVLATGNIDALWVDDTWAPPAEEANQAGHCFFVALLLDSRTGITSITAVRDILPTPLRTTRNEATHRKATEFVTRPLAITMQCRVVDFDVDCMPVGLLRSEGVVVFGTERIKSNPFASFAYPEYDVRLKTSLYMHTVLYSLFTTPYIQEDGHTSRVSFAKESTARLVSLLQSRPMFADCMDWLLHYTLHTGELRVRARANEQRKVLRAIVSLLQPHKEFYAILANCLRKTDYSMCGSLLEVTGSPIDLFNECISRNKIEEAVFLLRIVQTPTENTLQGLETACTGARRLLPTVVSRHNFPLAFELIRFIALLSFEMNLSTPDAPAPSVNPMSALERVLRNVFPISQSKDKKENRTEQNSQTSRKEGGLRLMGPLTETFGIVHEFLMKDQSICSMLEQHAVQMLASGRLLQLCSLFEMFSFDLSHFLSTRWKDVATAMDIREAFDNIHKEFGLPRGAFEVDIPAGMDLTTFDLAFFTPTQERLIVVTPVFAAFVRLLQVFVFHACTEYVLLINTVLLRVRDIPVLLREHPELTPSYLAMLQEDASNQGYQRLVYECGLTRTSPTKVS